MLYCDRIKANYQTKFLICKYQASTLLLQWMISFSWRHTLYAQRGGAVCVWDVWVTVVPFTLPLECGDPAPILRCLLCVKVSDAARGEILLWRRYTSGGSIRGAVLQIYMRKKYCSYTWRIVHTPDCPIVKKAVIETLDKRIKTDLPPCLHARRSQNHSGSTKVKNRSHMYYGTKQ